MDVLESSVDPEVSEYLKSIIQAAIEDDHDSENISEILNQFLSNEASQKIIDHIRAECAHTTSSLAADLPLLGMLGDQSPPSSPDIKPTPSCKSETISLAKINLDDSDVSTLPTDPSTTASAKPKSKLQQRKEARLAKKKGKNPTSSESAENGLGLVNDDHAAAWEECKTSNKLWGGRGRGGRGIRITGDNFEAIHLPSVSLCYEGNELLIDSKMDILKGHRYALLGRNGVGKSTLLKHIEAGNIPGLPRGLVVRMVKQQVEGGDKTTLQALVDADEYRSELLEEQNRVEKEMDTGFNMEDNAQRLSELAVELDVIDADNAEQRALNILNGLSFSKEMIHSPTASLSGGWRMRLALAQALFVPYNDLLLLDEVTNHLDLHGMAWLENYLTDESRRNPLTLICVSHDRQFLDSVCTDVIVMEHKRLVPLSCY